jgi:hypothetical protein
MAPASARPPASAPATCCLQTPRSTGVAVAGGSFPSRGQAGSLAASLLLNRRTPLATARPAQSCGVAGHVGTEIAGSPRPLATIHSAVPTCAGVRALWPGWSSLLARPWTQSTRPPWPAATACGQTRGAAWTRRLRRVALRGATRVGGCMAEEERERQWQWQQSARSYECVQHLHACQAPLTLFQTLQVPFQALITACPALA